MVNAGTSDKVSGTARLWTDFASTLHRLRLCEKFGVGEVVSEDVLLGVEAARAVVVGTVERESTRERAAVVVGGGLRHRLPEVVTHGTQRVVIDKAAVAEFGGYGIVELLLLIGGECSPQVKAVVLVVKAGSVVVELLPEEVECKQVV